MTATVKAGAWFMVANSPGLVRVGSLSASITPAGLRVMGTARVAGSARMDTWSLLPGT